MVLLLSECQYTVLKPPAVTTENTRYRIELVDLLKQSRSGVAEFLVQQKVGEEWVPAINTQLWFDFVGSELRVSPDQPLKTDANGVVKFEVRLADPLKYFRWVKSDSYPIVSEYRKVVADVLPTVPYSGEGDGWDKASIDRGYLIKLKAGEAYYWLPVPYKDIRPVLARVSEAVHLKKMQRVELKLFDQQRTEVEGVDVFLTGAPPPAEDILQGAFTSAAALKYAADVFPEYAAGKVGGYDKKHYQVYPGRYRIEVEKNGQEIFEDVLVFTAESSPVREIYFKETACNKTRRSSWRAHAYVSCVK